MFGSLEVNRFHWVAFFLWQIALLFCTQQIYPIFYNYSPERKCDDFDIYANSSCSLSKKEQCEKLKDCKHISLKEKPPFHSIVEQFDLYCDEEAYYATVIATCQFVGVLFGTIIYGHIGDHFGRKPVALVGISIGIVFAIGSGFAPSWPIFAALRFVVGSSIACVLVVFYTYILELILPQQRVFLRSFFNWGYARVIFTFICYMCAHWRTASIVTAVVVLPVVIAIIFLLPESPKWLLSKGRNKEAKEAKQKLDKLAGVVMPEDAIIQKQADDKIYTVRDLLANREIAKRTGVLCVLWFSTSLSAFGSDLNSRNLAGNFYANQFVSGIVTAFAKIFVFLFDEFVPSFDRRRLHQIPQALMICCYAAIMCLMIWVPANDCDDNYWRNWAIIIINIVGVSLIEITWDACYLVAVECFPTEIRTIGIGTCSLLARCGALLAPQMAYLSNISKPAPYGVVCCIGVFSLLVSLIFLPDTKGVDLNDVGGPTTRRRTQSVPSRKATMNQIIVEAL